MGFGDGALSFSRTPKGYKDKSGVLGESWRQLATVIKLFRENINYFGKKWT